MKIKYTSDFFFTSKEPGYWPKWPHRLTAFDMYRNYGMKMSRITLVQLYIAWEAKLKIYSGHSLSNEEKTQIYTNLYSEIFFVPERNRIQQSSVTR